MKPARITGYRLSSNCTRLCWGITLTPASSAGQALALSHDGRGDKRAFDRLRPNGAGDPIAALEVIYSRGNGVGYGLAVYWPG